MKITAEDKKLNLKRNFQMADYFGDDQIKNAAAQKIRKDHPDILERTTIKNLEFTWKY